MYEKLTGDKLNPNELRVTKIMQNGDSIQFRFEGDSGHPKVDIKKILNDGRELWEKISAQD